MNVMLMLNIYFACGSFHAAFVLWQLYRLNNIAEAYPPEDEEEEKCRQEVGEARSELVDCFGSRTIAMVVMFLVITVAWLPFLMYEHFHKPK